MLGSYKIILNKGQYYDQFCELLIKLAAKGQVVILIDEYDKPLIDNSILDALRGADSLGYALK